VSDNLAPGACPGDSGGVTERPDDSPASSRLTVTVTDGPGQPPTTWTLVCDPAGGSHPDPEGACRALEAARQPFAPVPADMRCIQVYGGPETATITGTWHGEEVAATYRRTDGCEIARWSALSEVLAPARRG
jgi:hypothetical protein